MVESLLQTALDAHRRGDLQEAELGYRAVLRIKEDQPDALALLGVVLDSMGRKDEALHCVRRAVALDPTAALFEIYLGNILASMQDWDGAIEAFEKADFLQKGIPDVHYNLANALRQKECKEEAEQHYLTALVLQPSHVMARNNLALLYEEMKRLPEAVALLKQVMLDAPDYLDGWLNLSSLSEKNGDYDLALLAAKEACTRAPHDPRPWFGMGVAKNRMERLDEAVVDYRKALSLDPKMISVWDNLGQAYQGLTRLDEAERAFRQCIACAGQAIVDEDNRRVAEAEYGNRHWHLALLQLLRGDYKRGFARYRARFEDVAGLARETWPRPLWEGEALSGKTILIMDEQGMGDCLMMARYIPLLKERGARVILYVAKALCPLFEGWPAIDVLVEKGNKIPDFDYYASIFDLPYQFGTSLETIPSSVPYLPVLEVKKELLLPFTDKPRIGVVWAGAPLHKLDARRSLPLNVFSGLFEETSFQFYSFNRDKREGDDALLARLSVVDLAPRLHNFADSACLMQQMDLVITCDTSTAHLAGGLGLRVWTLVPYSPDWRWLLAREDSPWYPTMRLFRQEKAGDWASVIVRVRAALLDQGLSRASL